MAKELPFFKFEPSEYMFGRIQKQSFELQGIFINICCKYWHKLGVYKYNSVSLDFGKSNIDKLLESKIIRLEEDHICILFLDDQLNECQKTSKINSENGKKSAKKRSTTVQRPFNDRSTDKIRGEEKREDEMIKISNLEFFLQSEDQIMFAYKYQKSIGLKLSVEQIKVEAERHDAGFSMQFQNADIGKWQQYFKYYFDGLKKSPEKLPYTPKPKLIS